MFFYGLMAKIGDFVAYRSISCNRFSETSENNFYYSGTPLTTINYKNMLQDKQYCQIMSLGDIYDIRALLCRFKLDKLEPNEQIYAPFC